MTVSSSYVLIRWPVTNGRLSLRAWIVVGVCQKQRYDCRLTNTNEMIFTFWQAFAERFTRDFLPADSLHALCGRWMSTELPEHTPFRRDAFVGRLKAAVTTITATIIARSGRAGPRVDPHPIWRSEGSLGASHERL